MATPVQVPAGKRLAYGQHEQQFGDLRVPERPGPHPLVIYIHGGGYQAAVTLDGASPVCAALTGAGFATWNIEYRRVGNGGGWPMTFVDVLAAAAFIPTLAEQEAVDLGRVYAAGQSAGGQLALWLASRAGVPAGQKPSGSSEAFEGAEACPTIRGAVALAPLTDMRGSAIEGLDSPVLGFLGGSPDEVGDRYAAASPLELLPIGVPQLIAHGTGDTMVPFRMSEAYREAAHAAGDLVEFLVIEGANHLDLWNPQTDAFRLGTDAAVRFLKGLS